MFRFFRSRVLDTLKYMPGPHYIRLTHLYMPYIMLIYSYTRIIYRSYTPFIALYTPYIYLDTPYIHLFLTIIPRAALDTRRVGYNYLISNKREWNNCFIKNAKYREFFPTLFVKASDSQVVFNFEQARTVTIFGEHDMGCRIALSNDSVSNKSLYLNYI